MTADQSRNFRQMFTQQVSLPEPELDLGWAALCLAGEEYPDIDVTGYLRRLDDLARQVLATTGVDPSPENLIHSLNYYLFEESGFTGNRTDYYNPENSFLNRVLDARVGIPITLSLLYIEVAQRLGLKCYGVGMPGHFLVALEDLDLYLDPFHSGRLLSTGDCRRLLQEMFDSSLTWQDNFLAPCSKHSILFRMLNNLKLIYQQNRDYPRAAGALQRMLLIDSLALSLYKEISWIYLQLKDYSASLASLEEYLRRAGEPGDAAEVRERMRLLRQAQSGPS